MVILYRLWNPTTNKWNLWWLIVLHVLMLIAQAKQVSSDSPLKTLLYFLIANIMKCWT